MGSKVVSRRAKKAIAAASANTFSGDETSRRKPKTRKTTSKKMRKWDADGLADEEDGMTLDYSAESTTLNGESAVENVSTNDVEDIRPESFGTRTAKGQFVLRDLDGQVHAILEDAKAKKSTDKPSTSGVVGSSLGALTGLFRNVVGGKVLTKSDLVKPIKGMEEHLLKKNVALEAAVRLCESVERELIGFKTGSFESKSFYRFQYSISHQLQVLTRPFAPPWNPRCVRF